MTEASLSTSILYALRNLQTHTDYASQTVAEVDVERVKLETKSQSQARSHTYKHAIVQAEPYRCKCLCFLWPGLTGRGCKDLV